MAPHGAQAVAVVDGVVVYLRERIREISRLDLELHSSVLPRDLEHVRELHYRFVNGTIVGEAKVWTYDCPHKTALIIDYWCTHEDLYTRLLRYVIDDLKLHYNIKAIYMDTVRVDEDERRLLGKALRELDFVMVDDRYAVLA